MDDVITRLRIFSFPPQPQAHASAKAASPRPTPATTNANGNLHVTANASANANANANASASASASANVIANDTSPPGADRAAAARGARRPFADFLLAQAWDDARWEFAWTLVEVVEVASRSDDGAGGEHDAPTRESSPTGGGLGRGFGEGDPDPNPNLDEDADAWRLFGRVTAGAASLAQWMDQKHVDPTETCKSCVNDVCCVLYIEKIVYDI